MSVPLGETARSPGRVDLVPVVGADRKEGRAGDVGRQPSRDQRRRGASGPGR